MSGKKVSQNTIIGQQGVNLVEKRVLEMGFLWYPTGSVEAGIDGYIELRNPGTDEALNSIILVQSKATTTEFQSETNETLEYVCGERDLAYWLAGNAPVILVRSRPHTGEAYWASVKDYFKEPARRKERRIRFDKRRDSFDVLARERLMRVGLPRDVGVYLGAQAKPERLYSNLLRVTAFADHIFLADTGLNAGEVISRLRLGGQTELNEWIVKSKRILSAHDLREYSWGSIVDAGTAEAFETWEWADSDDPDRQRDFVQLLNRCLRAELGALRVRYYERGDYYYFASTEDLSAREVSYRSLARDSKRTVFQAYADKADPSRIKYYRHSAFDGQFRRYDGQWFLEIIPSYHFTSDGNAVHPWYDSKLKGIKVQEKNSAVLGQVAMWADLLSEHAPGLFSRSAHSFIRFGQLESFTLDVGINEEQWLTTEEDERTAAAARDIALLPLFAAAEQPDPGDVADTGE